MVHKRRSGTAIVDTPNGILVVSEGGRTYHLPGGVARKGESRRKAAIRELREETGLIAVDCSYLFEYTSHSNHHKVFLIKCTGTAEPKNEIKHLAYFDGSNVNVSDTTKKIIEKYHGIRSTLSLKRCEVCGREDILPFKCNYCGKTFCTDHHLPESHNCASLSEIPTLYPYAPDMKPRLANWSEEDYESQALDELKRVRKPERLPTVKKRKNWVNYGLILAILFLAVMVGLFGQNFLLNINFNIDLSRYINPKTEPIVYFESLDSLIVFLESDDLNTATYRSNYTCVEFARDFIQRAKDRGFNCFTRYDLVGRELDAFNDAVPKGYIVFIIPDVGHTVVRTRIDDMDIIVDPQTDIVMLMRQREIQWWWFLTKTETDFTVLYEGEILKIRSVQ